MPSNLQTKIKEIQQSLKVNLKYTEAIIDHTPIGPVLPSGYKQVEYIQANGNAYINTNFKPNAHFRFESKYYYAARSTTWPTPFGCRSSNDGSNPGFYIHNMGSYLVIHWNEVEKTINANFDNKIIYLNNLDNIATIVAYTDNMSELGRQTWTMPTDYTNTYPLFLFTLNGQGSAGSSCYCSGYRLYYLKIYSANGNTLLRNYIPCKNASNVAGVWEDVSQTFLQSATSSYSFIAGPEID